MITGVLIAWLCAMPFEVTEPEDEKLVSWAAEVAACWLAVVGELGHGDELSNGDEVVVEEEEVKEEVVGEEEISEEVLGEEVIRENKTAEVFSAFAVEGVESFDPELMEVEEDSALLYTFLSVHSSSSAQLQDQPPRIGVSRKRL